MGHKDKCCKTASSGSFCAFGNVEADGSISLQGGEWTVTRVGVGNYCVTYAQPLDQAICPLVSVFEEIGTRDSISIRYYDVTANGFCVHISEGDNGTAPNTLRDRKWSFAIPCGDPVGTTIAGPAGADGAQGPQGIPGVPGTNGVDGQDGADGQDGQDGQDGADGAQGIPGVQGPPGPVEDQEICTGPFVDVSGRTGWTHTWTPIATANTGTVTEDWVQISTAETSPNCTTDITVNADLGHNYFQMQASRAYVWFDVRMLINGAAVVTYTFHRYRYRDERGQANVPQQLEIEEIGQAFFARNNVPAGATVTVELRRRYNFNAFQAGNVPNASARVISGLRAHFNVHYSPREIVTGRL